LHWSKAVRYFLGGALAETAGSKAHSGNCIAVSAGNYFACGDRE
jgi:hypothetical protein